MKFSYLLSIIILTSLVDNSHYNYTVIIYYWKLFYFVIFETFDEGVYDSKNLTLQNTIGQSTASIHKIHHIGILKFDLYVKTALSPQTIATIPTGYTPKVSVTVNIGQYNASNTTPYLNQYVGIYTSSSITAYSNYTTSRLMGQVVYIIT